MSEHPDRADDAGTDAKAGRGGGRSTSAWYVAVPSATFLLGGLLGGLVVGVGSDGGTDGSAGADGSPTASPTTPGPSTAVVVPDSCLEAAETVQQAIGLIRGGVEAIQNFQVDPILTLLDDLEDLDSTAREQAASCTGTRVTDAGEPDPTAPLPSTDSESDSESDGAGSETTEPTTSATP